MPGLYIYMYTPRPIGLYTYYMYICQTIHSFMVHVVGFFFFYLLQDKKSKQVRGIGGGTVVVGGGVPSRVFKPRNGPNHTSSHRPLASKVFHYHSLCCTLGVCPYYAEATTLMELEKGGYGVVLMYMCI